MPSEVEIYLDELAQSGKLQDGFVLSPTQRQLVKQAFAEAENPIKIKKGSNLTKEETLARSVIQDEQGQPWALLGFSKKIPQGVQATLKIAQNLETGEFCLAKITKIKNLEKEPRIKQEAEEEARHLIKKNLLIGYQHRNNPSEKYAYKHYNFIKILPGVKLWNEGKNDLGSVLKVLGPIEQCTLALKILMKLNELKNESIIHRDLHGGNILIDPKSMECNIIDFGLSVEADEEGFWYGKRVSDTQDKGPDIRFANGVDILKISDYIALIKDKTLNSIFESLAQGSVAKRADEGDILEYNSVDLVPAMNAVINYQEQLREQERVTPKKKR